MDEVAARPDGVTAGIRGAGIFLAIAVAVAGLDHSSGSICVRKVHVKIQVQGVKILIFARSVYKEGSDC